MAAQAKSSESFHQKHRSVVKHAQALTHEVTQLAEAYQHLDCVRREQRDEMKQIEVRGAAVSEQLDGKVQALQEQVTAVQHSATVANGCGSSYETSCVSRKAARDDLRQRTQAGSTCLASSVRNAYDATAGSPAPVARCCIITPLSVSTSCDLTPSERLGACAARQSNKFKPH